MGVLRYADHLMALVAYGAFLSLIFHIAIGLGPVARALLPFLIMAVAVVLYLLFTRLSAGRLWPDPLPAFAEIWLDLDSIRRSPSAGKTTYRSADRG